MRKDKYLLTVEFPHYVRYLRFTTAKDAMNYGMDLAWTFPDISWRIDIIESDSLERV